MSTRIPSDEPPARFEAFIGGALGHSYRCELTPEGLMYAQAGAHYSWQEPEILHPDDAAWGQALRALAAAGAGHWQAHYEPTGTVTDGTHWQLHVESPQLYVHAAGDNAYPGNFTLALAAVRTLLGERDFS